MKTITPSMDILISSNLERMLYYASEGDCALIARLMESLRTEGVFRVEGEMLERIRSLFKCGWADDAETSAMIREAWEKDGRLIDPHTAVALKVARRAHGQVGSLRGAVDGKPLQVLPGRLCGARGAPPRGRGRRLRLHGCALGPHGEAAPSPLAGLRSMPLLHKDVVKPEGMADFIRAAAARAF